MEPRREQPPEKLIKLADTKEEAVALVKEFWDAMPQRWIIADVIDRDSDMTQELTAGDRTRILQGKIREQKDKWVIIFQGNNQPLSSPAISWLKGKGII